MSKTLEIEFKTLLSKKKFGCACTYFQLTSTDFYIQKNYYFDTSDMYLKKQQMGLRIRLLFNKAELTLKIPKKIGLLEITDVLSLEEATHFINQRQLSKNWAVTEKLIQLRIQLTSLTCIGTLITNRAEKQIPQGLLALDENWYNNHHDFELELEVMDASTGKIAFSELLHLLTIKPRFTKNKVQRMIDTLP